MSNKKKIILFLGAVSLIAFGNYKQFTKTPLHIYSLKNRSCYPL